MADDSNILRQAMDAQGITDNTERAGLAAICMGESAMKPQSELSYANTSNDRIRMVFGSRVPDDDTALTALKADPKAFFNAVYGGDWGRRNLGNTQPDDGFNFRGRGFIQLTGRGNYTRYAGKIGKPEIVDNPDLANDPANAAAITIAYILDRYHGGGFESMMACVGSSSGDVADRKRAFYQEYLASGEYNYQPGETQATVQAPVAPIVAAPPSPVPPIPAAPPVVVPSAPPTNSPTAGIHPKTSAATLAGLLSTIIITELNRRGIVIDGNEGAAIVAVLTILASYLMPSNPGGGSPSP